MISQIHNANQVSATDTYSYATGPYTRARQRLRGWNEAEHSYAPGQPRSSAYQLTSQGKCSSAASGGPSGDRDSD